LIDYARSLKPRFKTGIISNAWPEARENIREHVNGDAFDVMLFSAEEGVAKPAQAIYERALTRLNVAPHEAIFVDDVEENVEAARTIGMRTFRFENTDQVIGQINRYLTEVK
jgi:epoxide hydrolase-like predicted phosphatase